MIWYSKFPTPLVTDVIVTSVVLVGQVTPESVNSISVGGFKAATVISLVIDVQLLVSLTVMV